MARIVKSVLQEELKRVKSLKRRYEEKMADLPPGYLLRRGSSGQEYFYLSYREGDKIKQDYLGKLSEDKIKKYKKQMKLKKQLRQQIKEARQNICYLEKLLKK